jgi:beta-lactam-binding protein with PASTA domain
MMMINLVGVPVRHARTRITEAGLMLGKISYEFTTSYEPNVVIRQVPESEAEIRQGSRVSFVISRL